VRSVELKNRRWICITGYTMSETVSLGEIAMRIVGWCVSVVTKRVSSIAGKAASVSLSGRLPEGMTSTLGTPPSRQKLEWRSAGNE